MSRRKNHEDEIATGTIILSAPKTGDLYYAGMDNELLGLFARVIAAAHPKDKFKINCDAKRGDQLYDLGVPDSALLVSGLPDIWVRDISPVMTRKGSFDFVYRPTYLKAADSKYFERKFEQFYRDYGVRTTKKDLILDGGNYCHNGVDKAVVCDTVLLENRDMLRETLIDMLEPVTGSRNIAVVPTEEGDTLGHADGMVSWLTSNVLAVNQFDEPFHSKVMEELEHAFPDVTLVVVPYEPTDVVRKGIADATGVYTNLLHTPNASYMLEYGIPADSEAKAILQKHLKRPLIAVQAKKATQLGGGLRCLSWQKWSTQWTIPL